MFTSDQCLSNKLVIPLVTQSLNRLTVDGYHHYILNYPDILMLSTPAACLLNECIGCIEINNALMLRETFHCRMGTITKYDLSKFNVFDILE